MARGHTSGPIETPDDIEAFFRHSVELQGREVEIGERHGLLRAHDSSDDGMARAHGRS